MAFGEVFDMNQLAVLLFGVRPGQFVRPLMGVGSVRIVDVAIALDGTVIQLIEAFDGPHNLAGGIPGVHQDGSKAQTLVIHHIAQHIQHVIQLVLAILFRRIQPIVNRPELVQLGVHVHTRHHPDATDHLFRISAPLPAYQLDAPRVVLVQHRVIEHDVSIRGQLDLALNLVPQPPRRHFLLRQMAVDRVVAEPLCMLGKVCERVVDLADQQKLAVIQPAIPAR